MSKSENLSVFVIGVKYFTTRHRTTLTECISWDGHCPSSSLRHNGEEVIDYTTLPRITEIKKNETFRLQTTPPLHNKTTALEIQLQKGKIEIIYRER